MDCEDTFLEEMQQDMIPTKDPDRIDHPTDDIASEPILEIEAAGLWIATDRDIWESWTGLRKVNGEDHHGDVTPVLHPDRIYTGHRVCPCRTCQAHVEPRFKPN
jgi:hypothetical protein